MIITNMPTASNVALTEYITSVSHSKITLPAATPTARDFSMTHKEEKRLYKAKKRFSVHVGNVRPIL